MDDGHFGYIQKFQKNHYPKKQFFFFSLIFLMFLQKWRSAARGFSQIWLQDKLES
jgi:hypothetical protein